MSWDMRNILVNQASAIKKAGGGGSSDLDTRVTDLETTVGDSSGGLVKDVSDLETTVGDSSSGLVKDVGDLQTATSGLLPLVFSTTDTKIGKWGSDDLYVVLVDGGTMTAANLDIAYTLPAGATMRWLGGFGVTASAFIPLSFVNTASVSNSIAIYYDIANSKIKITSGADESGTTITAIVMYSLSTNTRKKGGK